MNEYNQHKMSRSTAVVYLLITLVVFAVITIVFLFFPRPTYSSLEKRDLATFPTFTSDSLWSGAYAEAISHWFNDSEPFRDQLMEQSMAIRRDIRLNLGGEQVVVHTAEVTPTDGADKTKEKAPTDTATVEDDGVAKIKHSGIVVVGSGDKVRALMSYGGVNGGDNLARVMKKYAETMPDVRYYAMIVPLSSEFYMPEKVTGVGKPQITTIENVRNLIVGSPVTYLDIYNTLKSHKEEDIYLRTDHHWAPLGAFYAAELLAKSAGVPFRQLEDGYSRQVIARYVGSMYGYSKDITVKNSPEDFVYHIPNKVVYNTTIRNFYLTSDFKVKSESAPVSAPFFRKFSDGSGMAYQTFMGGDALLAVVKTGTKKGRRLLIIKDSYGNAVPGYLFYSFEEIHVVDFRYFTRNMVKYVKDNGITDMAFIYNVFNAYSSTAAQRMERFLTQGDGSYEQEKKTPAPAEDTLMTVKVDSLSMKKILPVPIIVETDGGAPSSSDTTNTGTSTPPTITVTTPDTTTTP